MTGKIFENILFLAEVFGDNADKDIPDLPGAGSWWRICGTSSNDDHSNAVAMLRESSRLARCFELSQPRLKRPMVRRYKSWHLWK
jgi:hypothetical protein